MMRNLVLVVLALASSASAFMPMSGQALSSSMMSSSRQQQQQQQGKGRMYMLFGGSDKKKKEEGGGAAKPGGGKLNPFDAMSKMNELATKSNTLTKDLAGTFVAGSAMEGKVKVTFTGTQVPMEVEITEEALAAGAETLSAALTEAMKEGHAKSVQLQQTKLTSFYEELGLGAAMKEMGKMGGVGGQ